MMLSELINESINAPDVEIRGISDDSRLIDEGYLFFAIKGEHFDGRNFVGAAIEAGAAAIVSDVPAPVIPDKSVPVLEVEHLQEKLGDYASRFFGEPSRNVTVVAVTGTNGKTSFTHLLAQAMNTNGMSCGLIGTMGFGVPGRLREAGLTTPAAIDLQRRIKELSNAGCDVVALEASSHGLRQGRLNGTAVDVAVLTNITHDHLDYHNSITEYRKAKQTLFCFESLQQAVINLDDDFSGELIAGLDENVGIVGFSLDSKTAEVLLQSIVYTEFGFEAKFNIANNLVEVKVPLFGLFNLQNVLAVAATLFSLDWTVKDIERALSALSPIVGRMDVVRREGKPTIFIDYAHTPDALEKSLSAIHEHFPGAPVCCLFGCGGDRDTDKRSVMGTIASKLADRIVLTSDNPRSEDPESIINAIKEGVTTKDFVVLVDRRTAILNAIGSAKAGDVVLIAGKGHEDYQELGSGRVPFSDYAVIREALDLTIVPVTHGKET